MNIIYRVVFQKLLYTILWCIDGGDSADRGHVPRIKVNGSEIELNTGVLLDKNDMPGSTNPLISACLFGITESFYSVPGTNYNFK
jgi:hypothetical protein